MNCIIVSLRNEGYNLSFLIPFDVAASEFDSFDTCLGGDDVVCAHVVGA